MRGMGIRSSVPTTLQEARHDQCDTQQPKQRDVSDELGRKKERAVVLVYCVINSASYSSSGTDCLLLSGSPCCWLKVWRASSSSSSSLEASSAAWLERAGGTATVPSAFWIDGFWQMYSGARPKLQISSSNWKSNHTSAPLPGHSLQLRDT